MPTPQAPAAFAGATPEDARHPAELDEDYYKRFEQPVNKGSEKLNSFANAVDALLDAAILPKKPLESTGRTSARAGDSGRSSELPAVPKTIEVKTEPAGNEVAAKQSGKGHLDPKRFEEPVNKGNLHSSRFDAEVNRALRPVSETSLPSMEAPGKSRGDSNGSRTPSSNGERPRTSKALRAPKNA